jgi:predicted dehydrogenase
LLTRLDIDLVIVCSPDHLHAKHALAALDANKHVLIDKPFATTLEDANRIAAQAELADRRLVVFHNRRWDADFLTLRRLIANGVLGAIVHFESHFDRWRPELAAVWKEAREGGLWLDLGPHLVDQALLLFGTPQAISADIAAMRQGAPAPDYFHVTLRYPRHRAILHSTKLAADHGLRFAVHGTRGSWIKHGIDTQEAATLAGASPVGPDWGRDPIAGMLTTASQAARPMSVENEQGDYRLFWQALEASLRNAGPNPVPVSDALAVMEVLHAGLASSAERREIAIGLRAVGGEFGPNRTTPR